MPGTWRSLHGTARTARRAGPRRLLYRLERRLRLRFLNPLLARRLYPQRMPPCSPVLHDSQLQALADLAAVHRASPAASGWDQQQATLRLLNQEPFPLAPPVRWHEPPVQDPLWAFQLHGWEWAWPALTDMACRERLLALWHDWVARVPVGRGLAWEPYPTSRRLAVWLAAWHLANGDRELLGAIAQHANYLAAHLERDLDNNHLVANAKALAWAGLLCPWLPGAERWRRLGLGLLWEALAAQTRPDGSHVENSSSYHLAVWLDGLETALLAVQSGEVVSPTAKACLARMGHFARALQRPDGRLPLLNDSIEDEPLPAATLFDLATAVLGQDLDASPPSLAESGYAVLRSGSGPRGTYLVFDAGDLGPAHCPGHGHADTLSFELWGRGEALVVDPGTYQYPAGPWRDYFRSTAAHSTATVDGLDQSTFAGPFRVVDMARGRLLAAAPAPREQAAAGEHDGYTRLPDPVAHQRRIRLRGRDEIVVQDTFLGQEVHRLVLRLHLPPCQVVMQGPAGAEAAYPGGAHLRLQVLGHEAGQLAIEQGWISRTWYRKEPSPVLAYELTAQLPITITMRLEIA